MSKLWKWITDVLRGIVIGVANIIPGVSGGTMMVSMGIYDNLIHSITHLFKEFRKSVATLLPYLIGMAIGIVALASLLKNVLFPQFPIQTYLCFIGLILGGLSPLVKSVQWIKVDWVCILVFVVLFALVLCLGIFGPEKTTLESDGGLYVPSWGTTDVLRMLVLVLMGCIASAAMVIPGVSGSMLLMLLGYYNDVISAIDGLKNALFSMNFAGMKEPLLVLLPFAVGIVLGIFGVAKLIEFLVARVPNPFYCGVLGMVLGSIPAILISISSEVYAAATVTTWITAAVAFAAGFALAAFLAKVGEKAEKNPA